MHYIPGLSLRCPEESEILGLDDAEMGEFAYDYVGLEQELGHTVSLDDHLAAEGGGREPDHHKSGQSISSVEHGTIDGEKEKERVEVQAT